MLYRLVSFASVGVLASAIAGSAVAQPCTQLSEYTRAGAVAHARVPVQPYGATCSFHRRSTVYSWGCAGGVCALSVDQQPFAVMVPTESLKFRPWKIRYDFFPLPL